MSSNSAADNGSSEEITAPPSVTWESFADANIITPLELKRLNMLRTERPTNERWTIVKENGNDYVELFIKLLGSIQQEPPLKNILFHIDDIFTVYPDFVQRFHNIRNITGNVDPYAPFLRLLSKREFYIAERCFRCLAKLLEVNDGEDERRQQREAFISAITQRLRPENGENTPKQEVFQIAIHALMTLLRDDENRRIFQANDGIPLLCNLIRNNLNKFQVLYEVVFCVWLLTYNRKVSQALQEHHIVPVLHTVLKSVQKEKCLRVALASLRNLLDKQEHSRGAFTTDMISVGLPKTLTTLSKRTFADEDLLADITYLNEKLEKNIEEISSFDEYRQEVLSGHLEWTPVHTSEKFWKENMAKIETNNFYILKELVKLLEIAGDDTQTLAITCHDLGQFVRYHPRGKRVLTDMGVKIKIMGLMNHKDEEVKRHALMCTQKMMIQNWEFLSR